MHNNEFFFLQHLSKLESWTLWIWLVNCTLITSPAFFNTDNFSTHLWQSRKRQPKNECFLPVYASVPLVLRATDFKHTLFPKSTPQPVNSIIYIIHILVIVTTTSHFRRHLQRCMNSFTNKKVRICIKMHAYRWKP